jgi:hypothetical protein
VNTAPRTPFNIMHRSPGRTRIRWAGEPDERHRVTQLARDLGGLPAVLAATPRPVTGSIIIEHPQVSWEALEQTIQAETSVDFRPQSMQVPVDGLTAVNTNVDRIDALLRHSSSGRLDLENIGYMGLMALAALQALRGNVAGPSLTLMSWAMNIARQRQSR